MRVTTRPILLLAIVFAINARVAHAAQDQGSNVSASGMKLIIAGKFSIDVPEFVKVLRTGPSSISPYEGYGFSWAGIPTVDVFLTSYRVSPADARGQCTVSSEFDRGDQNGAVFCEGEVLSQSLTTKIGTAKWKHAIVSNSPPPEPLPPSQAYVHTYIVVIPEKADGLLIEFWVAALGYKDAPSSEQDKRLWPMIRDEILPSLKRVNCK